MQDPIEAVLSPEMQALDEAIVVAKGVGQLAARIGLPYGSTVSNWKQRGNVPAEYCPAIERETGVRCERLRPDVAWDVLRMQAGDPVDVVVTPEYVGEERRAL